MANLAKDLQKLHLMAGDSFGLEFLSPFVHLKDFVRYYFTKFLVNIRHSFNDFSQSELEVYNRRHVTPLQLLLNASVYNTEAIIPIPKGMVNAYHPTIDSLNSLLGKIQADKIVPDLQFIAAMIKRDSVDKCDMFSFTKSSFGECKTILGSLFGKTGLTFSVAHHVFPKAADIGASNTKLLTLVQRYYPLVFTLKDLVDEIENTRGEKRYEAQEQAHIAQALMSVAYRLSIFAVVMEHVQDMEHAFVRDLDILLKKDK